MAADDGIRDLDGVELEAINMDSPRRFINRELSWLAFNTRVLEEAFNEHHPLLERLRFLSISASNLDEFFMVRVAGLRGQVREGVTALSQEGLTAQEQLALINERATELMDEQQRCWRDLTTAMRGADVSILDDTELTDPEIEWLEEEFQNNIFPILTPLALDPAHPFPFVPNLGFVLCFELKRKDGQILQALLPVPTKIGRFIRLPSAHVDASRREVRFISLEKVIVRFINHVFPSFEILAHGSFRVLRDSDVEVEEEAEDLVRVFENHAEAPASRRCYPCKNRFD